VKLSFLVLHHRVKTPVRVPTLKTFLLTLVLVRQVIPELTARRSFLVHRRHVKTPVHVLTRKTSALTRAHVLSHTKAPTVKTSFHALNLPVKTRVFVLTPAQAQAIILVTATSPAIPEQIVKRSFHALPNLAKTAVLVRTLPIFHLSRAVVIHRSLVLFVKLKFRVLQLLVKMTVTA
jgi:hypothetical protein